MARLLRRKLRQIDRAGIRSAEEQAQHILDERTEHLAARLDVEAKPAIETIRVLVCGAGREHYGIRIEAVAEVLPDQTYMPVPDAPPALVGVFGRSGRLFSVIDLATALGIGTATADENDRHLVLLRREKPHVALRVDRAYTVADGVPLTGEQTGGFRNEAIAGHAKVEFGAAAQEIVLSVLDTDRLLQSFLPSSVPGV